VHSFENKAFFMRVLVVAKKQHRKGFYWKNAILSWSSQAKQAK
jgi:hypothetical protein